MSTVPGPIIRFQIDTPGLSAAVGPAMQQIRDQTKATTAAIADEWKRTAAQIRASIATGTSTQREMTAEQQRLVALLDRQISSLRQRNELTNKELANLKAMTLERERQADALKRGVGVGVTSGTASALGQASLGLERVIDSLVNRYLGGAAGAFTRTIRDVSYYASQGGSATGGGIFGNIGATLSAIVEKVGPANIALGGFLATIAGIGAASAGVTISLAKQNEEIENTAIATGLSSKQVQVYTELAREMGLGTESVITPLSRLQSQLGEYIRQGKGADESTVRFVQSARELGVAVESAPGKLRPLNDILVDLSVALRALPENNQTAATLDALGIRARGLAPVLLSTKGALGGLLQEIEQSGPIIGDEQSRQLDKAKTAWDELTRSIAKSTLGFKEFIASGFLSVTGIGSIIGQSPSSKSDLYNQALKIRSQAGIVAPGTRFFTGSQADADADLKKQQQIEAGGARQLQIENLRKQYNDAIRDSQTEQAAQLLQQINSLNAALDLDKQRDKISKSIAESYKSMANAHPSERQPRFDDELYRLLGPSLGISRPGAVGPSIGNINSLPNVPSLLGLGQPAQNSDILANLKSVNDEYLKETQSETDKIKAEYDAQLDYWKFVQNQYPMYAKQAAQAITEIQSEENKKLADLQEKAFEKYKSQADSLFNDLIEGKTKSFTKQLEKDIEDIVTKPIKDQFEKIFGGMLQSLDQAINGKGSSSSTGAPPASSSSGGGLLGGIFSRLGLGPGGTAGYFPGSIGLGGRTATGSVAIQTGQAGVSTPTMYVQAQVVNISGGGTGTSGGLGIPGIPGASNFFGNNNPFSGSFGFFGNNSPVGGGTSAGGGLFGGLLGQLAGPLILGGLSARSGNTSGEAIAAGSVAGTLASKLIPGALGKTLGGVLPGVGTVAAGISQGGLGGGLEDVAGGAQIGTAIAPGIGTAIGAGVGALIGIINGIIGAGGWQNNVKNAMRNQAIYLPPSENFSFASNGSISSTLGTGFSTSGNTLSQYGLGNTPFYASAIYGPLTNAQKLQLQQTELGLNSNSPFLGGSTAPDPFTGERIPGYLPYPTSPPPYVGNTPLGYLPGRSGSNVVVQLSLPGYIDGQSAQAALGPHVNWIAQKVALQVNSSASGFGNNVRRAAYLP